MAAVTGCEKLVFAAALLLARTLRKSLLSSKKSGKGFLEEPRKKPLSHTRTNGCKCLHRRGRNWHIADSFRLCLAQTMVVRNCKHSCKFPRSPAFHLRLSHRNDLLQGSSVHLHNPLQKLLQVQQRELVLLTRLPDLEDLKELSKQFEIVVSATTRKC